MFSQISLQMQKVAKREYFELFSHKMGYKDRNSTRLGGVLMFIYTCKASTLKIISFCLLLTAAVACAIFFLPLQPPEVIHTAYLSSAMRQAKEEGIGDCVVFLSKFGWEVEKEPYDVATVTIPAEFDRIFTAYNNIQLRQGMDLSHYKQKSVSRYTYKVTNYPDYEGCVYANVFVYKDKIIGGDICSADVNGFLHGFEKS